MNTLTCTRPGRFDYLERDIPQLKRDHALVKIKRIGICGTDYHAYEGVQPFFTYPRVLGHELSGQLADFDHAKGFEKGDVVTILPYFNCGTCIACQNGKPNCCVHMQVCGVHIDGGMAEYLLVPSDKLVHGEGLGFDELALVEPLAIGAHGIRRAQIQTGEYVLVIGAGPIGLGTMEFARIAGAQVIALDVNENRLSFCREKLNIQHVLNPKTCDVTEALRQITGGDMPTVVIDATGNQQAINGAFQYLAHGARYVLIGLQGGEIAFSHPEFHKREATLMSSRNALRSDFEHVIASLKAGKINPANYITHRASFKELSNEFANWLKPETGVIKAMVSLD